ncbi:HPr-rel-A system PqqD family peptide chaperone [Massilia sp. G4R7]|uniref:HPr-rel-A system PqqD family peptide chaperone n=1 Tax=Massilia phyllostachyos TaxID=2898585 RepID=A0ABS8QCA8_9BURK|nr:HPr-rel-A system PqqD family peptide chaperone [Massilia phyllostachyos]MCD2519370.1 HPr-rel-A system PqqD family peptide chaperone [Massilia phyllostachyos]
MWQVIPGQSLAARQWDDELVVFNSLSGATHLLGLGATLLLGVLQEGPADESTLAAALHAEFALDAAEIGAQLPHMLARLAKLELIQPCPCSAV